MIKHTIQDSTGTKVSILHLMTHTHAHTQHAHTHQHRFIVFHVEFGSGCLRRFDSQGQEIEANFGQTALVRTGYLHSSYSETLELKHAIIGHTHTQSKRRK